MGEFLIRSHPILSDGTRVPRRDWGRLLALKCDIRDRLQAEGIITPYSEGQIISQAIEQRYREMYGDRQEAEQ